MTMTMRMSMDALMNAIESFPMKRRQQHLVVFCDDFFRVDVRRHRQTKNGADWVRLFPPMMLPCVMQPPYPVKAELIASYRV